jgi:hypothetical protein
MTKRMGVTQNAKEEGEQEQEETTKAETGL